MSVPSEYQGSIVSLIADLEAVEVTTDQVAKVIVNERTGTVIIGSHVRVSPVAVSHGALTVEVSTDYDISQPKPVSGGTTVTQPVTDMKVKEQPSSLMEIRGGSTIEELVRALNYLHVTPRDLIAILQSLKEAGALQAQLEII